MSKEKKAGTKKRESESGDDYDTPSYAYRKYFPPEKNPGDNDPIDLPLVMSQKDAAYVLAVCGHVLSPIEHSVTRTYIRGSRLTPGQMDVLDAALINLQYEEVNQKQREEQMKKASMTPEQRIAASEAESKERQRRAEEQLAADTIAWDAKLKVLPEPVEKDDGTPGGFTGRDDKRYLYLPESAPEPTSPKDEEADKRVVDGLAQEIIEANEYRKAHGKPLLPES